MPSRKTVATKKVVSARLSNPAKPAGVDSKLLLSQLDVQQSLLAQLKICNEILQAQPDSRSVQDWKGRLEFMLSGQSQLAFDTVIQDLLLNDALRTPIDFALPTGADQQVLVGLAYSEASGTDASEIGAIVASLVNCAWYATYTEARKKCYNTSFGDGTILSAIKMCSRAYGSAQWKRVMNGDALLAKAKLEETLIPSEVFKLKACCAGVAAVSADVPPITDTGAKRVLVQFNQATDSPPSPRQEKATKYGVHTFYAFKAGRECQ